jgi:two-component system, response regulator PdtaR
MENEISILIVEDEILSAMYLENRLAKQKFKVLKIVANGEAAVKTASEKRPDVILMDIRLAGHMDGLQAAEKIFNIYQPKIVFMTGYRSEEIKTGLGIFKNCIVLEKPLKISDIVHFINDVEI